jgi:hypothetical protein
MISYPHIHINGPFLGLSGTFLNCLRKSTASILYICGNNSGLPVVFSEYFVVTINKCNKLVPCGYCFLDTLGSCEYLMTLTILFRIDSEVFAHYFEDMANSIRQQMANSIRQQMANHNSVTFEITHVGDVLEEALSSEGIWSFSLLISLSIILDYSPFV